MNLEKYTQLIIFPSCFSQRSNQNHTNIYKFTQANMWREHTKMILALSEHERLYIKNLTFQIDTASIDPLL